MKYTFQIIVTLSFVIVTIMLIPTAYAVFYKEDFVITGFGIKNNHPTITVQGEAGRSFSVGGGDETYYAYTFVTDKGIFASTVALDEEGNKPLYGVDQFIIKNFKVGECIKHKDATGEPKFSGKTAEYIPKNLLFANMTKAFTLQVTLDDPDDTCDTGEHIYKVFSSK